MFFKARNILTVCLANVQKQVLARHSGHVNAALEFSHSKHCVNKHRSSTLGVCVPRTHSPLFLLSSIIVEEGDKSLKRQQPSSSAQQVKTNTASLFMCFYVFLWFLLRFNCNFTFIYIKTFNIASWFPGFLQLFQSQIQRSVFQHLKAG